MIYDAIVIGGGPSGLLAAATAGARGRKVLLLERNERIGRKLMITGKGRCNLTNNCDTQTLHSAVCHGTKFLYSAFSAFCSSDTMKLFESLGVPLKTERGNRVFPQSDRASDIVDALRNYTAKNGVLVKTLCRVESLIVSDGAICGVALSDKTEFFASHVLIATGGASYPATGSTGDGYALAKSVGHNVTPVSPSLIPVITDCRDKSSLMGLSLKNVRLTVANEKTGREVYSEQGEMLFTHFGLSGPLVLSASAHMTGIPDEKYKMVIDMKPALSHEKLDNRLLRDFSGSGNKNISNCLRSLLPRKIIRQVLLSAGISDDQKPNSITKEQRMALTDTVKAITFTAVGFRSIEEAIITRGGVSTNEVMPKTMESKLIRGLFFSGEVLDLDAYTGGFNLQIAFSTGYCAGMNI